MDKLYTIKRSDTFGGKEAGQYPYIGMSKEECGYLVKRATELVVEAVESYREKRS